MRSALAPEKKPFMVEEQPHAPHAGPAPVTKGFMLNVEPLVVVVPFSV
jgi:hypothetical protein